ncbi:MAG TPA: hypothetical protein VGH21_07190, partial [Solirubrobacteraceae bacterium]
MRSRVIAGCAVVALALGVQAAAASAAKPVLWLKSDVALERAAPKTPVTASMAFESSCLTANQKGTLATNGKPVDKLTLDPTASDNACAGEKIAGSMSSFTLKPEEEGVAMTVKSSIHVFFEPWCVYAVPKKITMPTSTTTVSEVTVPAPLEQRASFGAC